MKLLGKVFLLLFLTSILTHSQNYYLDSENGSDLNSGTTPNSPWKTISKINKSTFQPGDKILFKSGLEWRGELRISSRGTAEAPITISSYGSGEKPIIKGSEIAKYWRKHSNIVWQSKFEEKPACIWLVDEDKTIHWGLEKETIDDLENNYDFVWQDSILYLYLGANPSSTFPQIECSVRDYGIINNLDYQDIDYITIDNIEIMFTRDANFRAVDVKGWTIINCYSHHSGVTDETNGQGIQYEGEDGLFTNNVIYENGQHGFFLSSFGTGLVKNNIIEKNKIYNNYHTGIDLMNDGGDELSHTKTIIRQNLVYETPNFKGIEVGIQTLGYGNGLVTNVKIHHNIVAYVNGAGISAVSNSDSIFIHNNTVYETESSCINLDNHKLYAEAYNNIGVNNNYYAAFFAHDTINKKIDYNIWNTKSDTDTKLTFIIDEYYSNHKSYSETVKFDVNGSDKEVTLTFENSLPVGINETSISKDAGKIFDYEYDFYGNKIDGKLDIGAIEVK
ncbi:MAG: right-handed parallel beta-helix repeat-containing protein [Melioribacteraceae bacterium]